jgi:hypothetical protein
MARPAPITSILARSRLGRVRRPSCSVITGPDTETAVSLLVALEEAAEAELRAAALG